MSVPGLYDGPSNNHFPRVRSFDDSEPYFGNKKPSGRSSVLPESNVMKSIAADNVKASNVAKIKVVVCAFHFMIYLQLFYWLVSSSNNFSYLMFLFACSL